MIIIAVIQDELVEGQRKAKGRQIRKRVAIGAYRYGWSVATSTGNAGVFIGQIFPAKLEWMARSIPEYCDNVSSEDFRGMMQKSLCVACERVIEGNLTLGQLDDEFSTTKRAPGSTGELLLYKQMRDRWARDRDVEKGDLVLWSCTGDVNV